MHVRSQWQTRVVEGLFGVPVQKKSKYREGTRIPILDHRIGT